MKITNREEQIIRLVADELTTKEIAAQLFISNHTVVTHRKNLMEKLKVKNAAGLVRKGFESGLLRLAMMFLLLLQIPLESVAQDVSVGLEVDRTHAVVFGDSINQGNAIQMLWLPSKKAFRAGQALVGDWLYINIGDFSAAFGENNYVPGDHSMAWGKNNTNNGQLATAWGLNNVMGVNGQLASSWGEANGVNAYLATSWGYGNNVNGRMNTVWGYGNATSVIAPLATVFGKINVARDSMATVWGDQNIGDNVLTTAWGRDNRAGGYASTVTGLGNVAKGYAGFVTGLNCDTLAGQADQNAFFDTTPLFVIGNGTGVGANPRSNAMTVFGNGRVKLGSGSAGADLHIKQSETEPNGGSGGIRFEHDSSTDYWQIGHSGLYFSFSKDGNRRAYITPEGQYIDDESFRSDDQPITKSLKASTNDILNIVIGSKSSTKSKKQVKVNAAQFLKDFPEMVVHDENGKPFGIDYRQLYLTAIAALQEEIRTNAKQQKEIDELKKVVFQN